MATLTGMRVLLLKEPPSESDDPCPYERAFLASASALLGGDLAASESLAHQSEPLTVSYLPLQHCEYDDTAAAQALSDALSKTPPPSEDDAGVVCNSVVLTTQRACVALTRALPLLEPEPELRWRAITSAYVVGPRTAALVESELPHLEVVPAGGAPKASVLLDVIGAAVADELHPVLLRLHSSDRPDSLAQRLRELDKPSGVIVQQAAVYRLSPVPTAEIRARLQLLDLLGPLTAQQEQEQQRPPECHSTDPDEVAQVSARIAQASEQTHCCWVVCFSPLRLTELAQIVIGEPDKGGGAAQPHSELELELEPETQDGQPPLPVNSWMADEAAVKLVAMGPTTRAALERLGLPCAATAATPSPDGIVEAIITACSATKAAKGADAADEAGYVESQEASCI